MAGTPTQDRGPRPVPADPLLCGCAGKTPLDRVVRPAREEMRTTLEGSGVELGPDADAAAFPLTEDLDRETGSTRIEADGTGSPASDGDSPREDGRRWALTATVADSTLASDPETFAAGVGRALASLGTTANAPVTVGKGHAVQVPGADAARQWTELLRPVGPRRDGYRVASVDLVHAFPDLDPERQARIATVHALNDCYAAGAARERAIRPVVAVPEGTALSRELVREWFRDGAPDGVAVHSPAVVDHDGEGWLFGATATAATDRNPAVDVGSGGVNDGDARIRPDDRVLLHRPVGGLAAFALSVVDDAPGSRDAALDALTADHRRVASVVASFRPRADEAVDPDRHVLAATDVSGPGLAGVGQAIASADDRLGLEVERIPVLHPGVDAVADRWILPDATVETNGPIATVARPTVADRVASRLSSIPGADPVEVGRVEETGEAAVEPAPGVALDRYVETASGGDRG